MTRWSLFLQTLSLLHHFLGLYWEGRLLDETAWEKCTLFDVNVKPKQMSVSELERGLIELVRQLYSPAAKQARTSAFRGQLRRSAQGRRNGRGKREEQTTNSRC